jgi:hypothetical protein
MTFLRRWSATLLVAALPPVSDSAIAETYELKVLHFLPPNHTINKEMQRWADEASCCASSRSDSRSTASPRRSASRAACS